MRATQVAIEKVKIGILPSLVGAFLEVSEVLHLPRSPPGQSDDHALASLSKHRPNSPNIARATKKHFRRRLLFRSTAANVLILDFSNVRKVPGSPGG